MRKILIVGAGLAGLHLAHGLLDHGYDVTVITGRTSEEVRRDRRTPLVGFTLPRVAVAEASRSRGLNFWDEQAPKVQGVTMSFRPAPTQQVDFTGHFDVPATVIDRRLKCADWLEHFEDRGGKVVIHGVTNTDLDYFTRMFDLTVMAVGGGAVGELFDADPNRLSGARPRMITQLLLDEAPDNEVRVVTAPWGEIFQTPILTAEGTTRAVMVAGAPKGPLDCRGDEAPPLDAVRARLHPHAPDVAEGLSQARLLPVPGAITQRVLTPVVRDPIAALPSGGLVLGIGDVLSTQDPITGRETPDETSAAESYLSSILDHGDRAFDEKALHSIFDRYFRVYGADSADFTRRVSGWWDHEPDPHVLALLAAAQSNQYVADLWVQGFDDPRIYTDLLGDPDRAYSVLSEVGILPSPPEHPSLPPA